MNPWAKRAIPFLPFALPAMALAWVTIGRVEAKVGHAAATLDDAYIHFQYARAFAEGHPLRYHAGESISSGATSLLWPLVLAPCWAAGLRGGSIVWAAWILSYAALGALAFETYQLTRRLTSSQAAIGAAAMVFAFSGFAWCAASGMEVVPFAWLIARTVRRSSDWVETEPAKRSVRDRRELILLAALLPLLRPEGTVFALLVAGVLAFRPRLASRNERARALFALAVPVAMPLFLQIATGSARSSTMEVKLLPGNPYYVGGRLLGAIANNARILVGTLLDGDAWSQEFLPKGGAPIAMAGLVGIVVLGLQRRRYFRAGAILIVALAMFIPCAYDTFLWNRLRYLWPFATGWLIGLACAAELAGDLLALIRPRWKHVGPIFCGAVVGALAMRLDWTIDDVAESASGIDRQQVALGRWAKDALPPNARIGVNDTGAIAYFGERHTFDVVGLTTPEEARYWVAGAGSRLEHYERLYRASPERFPTHFIVYPEWMACDAVLGELLREAVVTDATILGGTTMRAYVADVTRLGSGEMPWSTRGEVVDAVDVADLESEADHGYALFGAATGEQSAYEGATPDGRTIVDGGRTLRTHERFSVRVRPGASLVTRIATTMIPTRLRVVVGGAEIGAAAVSEGDWTEVAIDLPRSLDGRIEIEERIEAPSATFHHWIVAAR